MAKEKNYNPVQAQHKADKARAIKKGRAEAQARKNEKLARRNPQRLQKEIDDLKAITSNGGKLTKHEEQMLDGLEKELKAVNKARDALGDKAPTFGSYGGPREGGPRDGRGGGVLGKRRRGHEDGSSSEEDVPEDVKRIPMPRDTPPPIPKEIMDKWWAKRRARREAERAGQGQWRMGEDPQESKNKAAPAAPPEAKTVYEAKPMVRDLQKEAVKAFVPVAVQMKLNRGKGKGGLMEPEEADRLEEEGYLKTANLVEDAAREEQATEPRKVTMEEVEDDDY